MATGLEALGAASAVLQVISFASEVSVACKKIYDGKPTSEVCLKHHAKQMSDAVGRLETRLEAIAKVHSKFSNQKLQDVAEDCKRAAEDLEKEAQFITSLHVKGNILKAIHATFRASGHQKKIQRLELSLSRYRQVMETEMMSHLCSRSDAISLQQGDSFHSLAVDVQGLIAQIAQGHTMMENLIRKESALMRDAIIRESVRSEGAINAHTATQALAFKTAAGAQTRCDAFLKSLKFPQMKQRYNAIMDSGDATFDRVFASCEGQSTTDGCHESSDDDTEEIGRSWALFVAWLQSDASLFYIRGKPGSGKSTLVKFIVDNDKTQRLVECWSPDTFIISHYFWKIGVSEQNSIKGLLCSLLYQRLQNNQQLIHDTLDHFRHLSSHTEYHDWSVNDLETALQYTTNLDAKHSCIFIDGIDEIRNQDGFSKLLQSIEKILSLPKTKICVSTRPEPQVVRWLCMKKASGILLEDLTKPDMRLFVREKLQPLSSNHSISTQAYGKLSMMLVNKAQGVFLWLYLATRSLITGIENKDSEDLLVARVHELPGELEDLYTDMWQRFNENNSVYREIAARYYYYALQQWRILYKASQDNVYLYNAAIDGPTLFQIACAEDLEAQETVLLGSGTINSEETQRLCDRAKASIHTRSAGLLQVKTREVTMDKSHTADAVFSQVVFIHRTAHDFLVDTETGQTILGRNLSSTPAAHIRVLKGLICHAVAHTREWGLTVDMGIIFDEIIRLPEVWGNEGLQAAITLIRIIQPFYDEQRIRSLFAARIAKVPFLCHLIGSSHFDDFIISSLAKEKSMNLATNILRESWIQEIDTRDTNRRVPSSRIVEALISLGADPHNYGPNQRLLQRTIPFVSKGTAFTNLLMRFIMSTERRMQSLNSVDGWHLADDPSCETLITAISMARTCSNLDSTVLLFGRFSKGGDLIGLPMWALNYLPTSGARYAILEPNLQFSLLHLLSKHRGDLAKTILRGSQAQELLLRLRSPSMKLRLVLDVNPEIPSSSELSNDIKCYRIPLRSSIVSSAYTGSLLEIVLADNSESRQVTDESETDLDIVTKAVEDSNTEEVGFEAAILALANEGLGFCTFGEADVMPTAQDLQLDGKRFAFPLTIEQLQLTASRQRGMII
ncbi:hypothetical protein BFJ71_g16003 [Fusarium oxysporum]|nr:hypothetical protein BFJ71_g16003 [Fusarium oxysporum]